MTWKELKEFAETLNEEQLQQTVILQREDEAIVRIHAECFEQDQFVELGSEEDGCINRDTMWSIIRDNSNYYRNGEDHFKKVYDCDTPMLFEEI